MGKRGPKRGTRYTFKKWRYFFLDDKLHKTLSINIPHDEVLAWDYIEHKKVIYAISAVKKYGEPGIRRKDAARILNRSVRSMKKYSYEDNAIVPQRSYSLETGKPGPYFYSKKDITRALEYIGEQHRGRPRNDGMITNRTAPTKAEVRAAMEYGMKLYTQDKDGKIIRVWEADSVEW